MALQDTCVCLALVLRGTPEVDCARCAAGGTVAVLASRVTMEKVGGEHDERREIGGAEPPLTGGKAFRGRSSLRSSCAARNGAMLCTKFIVSFRAAAAVREVPTGIGASRGDVLVRKIHVVLVLTAVFGQALRGLILGDVIALLDLLFDPGEPPDVRRTVSEVGEAEAVDLDVVLNRLHLLDVRRQNGVPTAGHHKTDGVRSLRRDNNLRDVESAT